MRRVFILAVKVVLAAAAATPVALSQSLLDRPPNLSGGWVGTSGTLYFNFLHRFAESGEPEHKVSNVPTFLVAVGLPSHVLLGFNYATNSQLAPRYPNEWEFFGRFAPFVQDEGAPLDLAGQVGYNLAAEGIDGEVSLSRRVGPVRLLSAARILSDPLEAGKTRFALGGGSTIRLGRFLALAGDVASLMNRTANEEIAWSAGLHIAIPLTPHTLSLQAANTITSTLQGSSRGTDDVRYGFEFTIPLTLRRYFGAKSAPASPPGPVEAETPDTSNLEPAAPSDTVTPPPAVAQPPVRDTVAREAIPPRDTAARTPSNPRQAPATPQPAARRAVVNAGIRNFAYLPGRIEVSAGTTVQWKNNDPVAHTVTASDGSFNSGLIESGKVYRRTFTKPGTYSYYCLPHTFMKGVIVVR